VRSTAVLAAAVGGLTLVLSACTAAQPSPGTKTVTITNSNGSTTTSTKPGSPSTSPSSTKPALPETKVHVTGFPDGSTVGVGMPIIAQFNKKITSAQNFVKDTTVTVNGQTVHGGWYFEFSDPASGHVMEAHYRLRNFWPAHAHVHVAFHLKGVAAGISHHHRLVFDGALTSLDFHTGARNIGVVDDSRHILTIHSDGKLYGRFPVSLGAPNTPTFRGTKVIMEQRPTVCMHDTAGTYYECGIKWDQRLTYSGEYLHSAPWNVGNIGHTDTSNGCTNLLPNDALRLYHFLRIGDVVEYPNADGPPMTLGKGYGDWNLTWSQWQTGGALSTQ
jgi:lipoprotein-anchoring transpeptidase ErfK/SrfK